MQFQAELCRLPKSLTFEYHENQQLNTTLTIQNLTDRVIDFKFKCNKPELYLVKPMDGSIYNKETMKIVFKRKQLQKAQFQAYLRNPGVIQEKFMVEVKSVEQDAFGAPKTKIQSTIIFVKFSLQQSQQKPQPPSSSDQKRLQTLKNLQQRLKQKQNEYERVENEQRNTIKKLSGFSNANVGNSATLGINQLDLISLIVVFILVGLAL